MGTPTKPGSPAVVRFGNYCFPEVGAVEIVTASGAKGSERNSSIVSVVCLGGGQPALARGHTFSVALCCLRHDVSGGECAAGVVFAFYLHRCHRAARV